MLKGTSQKFVALDVCDAASAATATSWYKTAVAAVVAPEVADDIQKRITEAVIEADAVAAQLILTFDIYEPSVASAVNTRNISVPIVPTPSERVSPMFPVNVANPTLGTATKIGDVFCAIVF